MQWMQKTYFYNSRSREKLLENFTFDLYVPKLIPLGEDEEQWIWKSRTPKIIDSMTQTMILTLQSVDFGNDDLLALTIFLFPWRWKTKSL